MSDTVFKTQVEQVVKLRDEQDLTYAQIAQITGLSETTARRRYKSGILSDVAESIANGDTLTDFPDVEEMQIQIDGPYVLENKTPIERFQPLVRTGDAIVTCDFHIPLHNPKLINTMIAAARHHSIDKLIIAGDYWNMESFSSFLPFQPEASIEIERYEGNYIMHTLLETFSEVDFIWGNHDFRLSKKLGFKRSFEECMRWMFSSLSEAQWDKLRVSELDYMHYYPEVGAFDSGLNAGREYRICHPRNFSSIPLTVGRKLAQKHNCDIITAHSHHFAIGASPNGINIVIEGGGFFDKHRTEYIQKSSTHHEWVPGFTIFKDGIPELVSPIFGNDKNY